MCGQVPVSGANEEGQLCSLSRNRDCRRTRLDVSHRSAAGSGGEARVRCHSVTALVTLITVTVILSTRLGGIFVYNRYQVDLVGYLRRISAANDVSPPPRIYELLNRSASWGNRYASEELGFLIDNLGSDWSVTDPLLLWMGIQQWHSTSQASPYPAAIWGLANTEYARIEAEQMLLVGVRTPNPFVSYRRYNEQVDYVALFWGLNSLEVPVTVLHDGSYKLTIRAKDWPPVPLRIRAIVDEQAYVLEWDQGDRAWRDQDARLDLARGRYNLQLTYLPPSGNKTQKASIDYIVIERVN